MVRADLHYALAVDREIFDASRVDPALLDPVVRVVPSLPGIARPFVVLRDYQGPAGDYVEYFTISDARGREIARSDLRRIRLSGEMFEDRTVDVLDEVVFSEPDEHTLTFHINDRAVGSVPLFLETGLGGDPRIAAEETFKKAIGKGEIIWLTVPQPAPRKGAARDHTQPVWFVAQAGKIYVFSGPGEQDVTNLAAAGEVEITARSKDHRSRVSRVPAQVRVVAPDDELWTAIAKAAVPKRLNLPDVDGDATIARWRETCVLVELTPRFKAAQAGAA